MARQTGGRVKALGFLALSGLAALFASALIYSVISNYNEQLDLYQQPEQTVQVMVAATNLHQGKNIVPEDLIMTELSPDYVPDSVLMRLEQAIGRVPRERILANEFIREERLANAESGIGLNAIIPRGMRAISINITGGSAVSGFLNPSNYVDILVTFQGSEEADTQTVTLLTAVTVLAVDARLGDTSAGAIEPTSPSITLAVTPEQAEKLTHANSQGDITLTLRNDIDVTSKATHGVRSSDLLGGETGDKRIPITEWKKATSEKGDGSVIIIKGPSQHKQKVR